MKTTNWKRTGWAACLALVSFPAWAVTLIPEGYDPSEPKVQEPLEIQEELSRPAPEEPPIPLGPKVVVRLDEPQHALSGQIHLADVGTIQCEDPVLLASLGKIDLGQAPQPGKTTYVYPRRIETALRHLGLSSGDFEIQGPDRVAIESTRQEVPMEEIEEAITAAFAARDKEDGNSRTDAALLRRPRPMNLPPGEVVMEVADLDRPGSGLRNVVLNFYVKGKRADTQTFSVRATRSIQALVAAKDLETGKILTGRDVTQGWIPEPGAEDKEDIPSDPSVLLGAALKRAISAGKPVAAKDIEWIPLAKKGEKVDVVKKVGNVRLAMRGTLLEDLRFVGQNVKVKTGKSKKDVTGTAVSEGLVEVR